MKIVQIIAILFLFIFSSCTRDKVINDPVSCEEEVSYDDEIKFIIDVNCSYVGCHIQGFASGDFSDYEGLEPILNESKFESRAINLRDMPPSYATGNITLSDEDFQMLQCWIQGGYLESK